MRVLITLAVLAALIYGAFRLQYYMAEQCIAAGGSPVPGHAEICLKRDMVVPVQ